MISRHLSVEWQYLKKIIMLSAVLLLSTAGVFCQQKTQKFDYGKNSKQHGVIDIEFLLSDTPTGDNGTALYNLGGEIDLNKYPGQRYIVVRFSRLKLGLKTDYSTTKQSMHNAAYCVEVAKDRLPTNNLQGLTLVNRETQRVNSNIGSDYHVTMTFVYQINIELPQEVSGTINIPFQIVGKAGAAQGEKLEGGGTTRMAYTIIPNNGILKLKELEREAAALYKAIQDTPTGPTQKESCLRYVEKYNSNSIYPEQLAEVRKLLDTYTPPPIEVPKNPEDELYNKVLKALEFQEKEEIISLCEDYIKTYPSGKYYDFMLKKICDNLPEGEERQGYISRYIGRNGEYKDPNKNNKKPQPVPPPIIGGGEEVPEEDTITSTEEKNTGVSVDLSHEPYIPPSAEMQLVSNGIVITNAKGGSGSYIIKIKSREDGIPERLDVFEKENYKLSFSDNKLKGYAGKTCWLVLMDKEAKENEIMATLNEVYINKRIINPVWIAIVLVAILGYFGYHAYQKYFVV